MIKIDEDKKKNIKDADAGDMIEFGKFDDSYKRDYGENACWKVLKKLDCSNLKEDDQKCLDRLVGNVYKDYKGKVLIVYNTFNERIWGDVDVSRVLDPNYKGCLFYNYNNPWFNNNDDEAIKYVCPAIHKEKFPVILNETENKLLIEDNNREKGFITYDFECNGDFNLLKYFGDDFHKELEKWKGMEGLISIDDYEISDLNKFDSYDSDEYGGRGNLFVNPRSKCLIRTNDLSYAYNIFGTDGDFDTLIAYYEAEGEVDLPNKLLALLEDEDADVNNAFYKESMLLVKILVIKIPE